MFHVEMLERISKEMTQLWFLNSHDIERSGVVYITQTISKFVK